MATQYLAMFVNILFSLLNFAIVARILLSWVQMTHRNRAFVLIYDITEPILGFFKKMIPPVGMIDFSPIVAFLALDLARAVILALLTAA